MMSDHRVSYLLREIAEAYRSDQSYMWELIDGEGERTLAEAPDASLGTREYGLLMDVIAEGQAGGGAPFRKAVDEALATLEGR